MKTKKDLQERIIMELAQRVAERMGWSLEEVMDTHRRETMQETFTSLFFRLTGRNTAYWGDDIQLACANSDGCPGGDCGKCHFLIVSFPTLNPEEE